MSPHDFPSKVADDPTNPHSNHVQRTTRDSSASRVPDPQRSGRINLIPNSIFNYVQGSGYYTLFICSSELQDLKWPSAPRIPLFEYHARSEHETPRLNSTIG